MLDSGHFMRLDRIELDTRLSSLLGESLSANEFRKWLVSAIAGDDFELDESDADLVVSAVYRLEATKDDSELASLARKVHTILNVVEDNHIAEGLIRLDAQGERLEEVLKKYLGGTIGRAGLLSYFAARAWPQQFREAVAQLGPEGLQRLLELLKTSDYEGVSRLLR